MVSGGVWRYILVGWDLMDIFYGFTRMDGGIFWVVWGGWAFFMGRSGCVDIFLLVDGCEWMFILDGGGEWSLVLVKLIYNYFLCGTLNL